MKVQELLQAIEEFQKKLIEHKKLWGGSLDDVLPDYPITNREELEEQSRWLSRRLGALRPYILRFESNWIMVHPGTGITWDALDSTVGLADVAQRKGPSLEAVIPKIDQIIGRISALDPNDNIPDDPKQPIRPGIGVDNLMLAYLNHLHPFIVKGCSQLFIDGHYTQAVEEAAKAVSQYIRNKTGLTTDGATLAENAFSINKPILAFSDLSDENKKNEQLGFMEILKGFAKGVRNPLAHTHGKQEEARKAFEYLVFASLLCRRIDDASPKTS